MAQRLLQGDVAGLEGALIQPVHAPDRAVADQPGRLALGRPCQLGELRGVAVGEVRMLVAGVGGVHDQKIQLAQVQPIGRRQEEIGQGGAVLPLDRAAQLAVEQIGVRVEEVEPARPCPAAQLVIAPCRHPGCPAQERCRRREEIDPPRLPAVRQRAAGAVLADIGVAQLAVFVLERVVARIVGAALDAVDLDRARRAAIDIVADMDHQVRPCARRLLGQPCERPGRRVGAVLPGAATRVAHHRDPHRRARHGRQRDRRSFDLRRRPERLHRLAHDDREPRRVGIAPRRHRHGAGLGHQARAALARVDDHPRQGHRVAIGCRGQDRIGRQHIR